MIRKITDDMIRDIVLDAMELPYAHVTCYAGYYVIATKIDDGDEENNKEIFVAVNKMEEENEFAIYYGCDYACGDNIWVDWDGCEQSETALYDKLKEMISDIDENSFEREE